MCTIGIWLYPQAEVLDFAGPFEVFTTASRLYLRKFPEEPERFRVVLVADSLEPVPARAGFTVLPQVTRHHHPALDILIIPGGVVDAELDKPEVLQWIREIQPRTMITASVCTGAFLLAQLGLLDGLLATTHWEDCDDLARRYPQIDVRREVDFVDCGKIVTSAGISAGINMSLHLVQRMMGREWAEATARQMEYRWAVS